MKVFKNYGCLMLYFMAFTFIIGGIHFNSYFKHAFLKIFKYFNISFLRIILKTAPNGVQCGSTSCNLTTVPGVYTHVIFMFGAATALRAGWHHGKRRPAVCGGPILVKYLFTNAAGGVPWIIHLPRSRGVCWQQKGNQCKTMTGGRLRQVAHLQYLR